MDYFGDLPLAGFPGDHQSPDLPLKGCWRKFRSPIGYYIAWPYIHLTLYRPSLGYLEVLRYHTCPILMVPDLLLPLALRRNLSVHQGQLTPSSIGCAPGKQASASFMSAFHPCFRHFPGLCVFLMGFQFPFSLSPFPLLSVAL